MRLLIPLVNALSTSRELDGLRQRRSATKFLLDAQLTTILTLDCVVAQTVSAGARIKRHALKFPHAVPSIIVVAVVLHLFQVKLGALQLTPVSIFLSLVLSTLTARLANANVRQVKSSTARLLNAKRSLNAVLTWTIMAIASVSSPKQTGAGQPKNAITSLTTVRPMAPTTAPLSPAVVLTIIIGTRNTKYAFEIFRAV